MAKNKLSIAKVMLVLIILLSLGTVLGVTAYSLSLKGNPLVNDEFSDWQTYTNKKGGYEFKHPKDWVIIESSLLEKITITMQGDWQKPIIGAIEVGVNPNELPLEDWLNQKSSNSVYENIKDAISGLAGGGAYPGSGLSYVENDITVGGLKGIDLTVYKDDNPTNWRSIVIPKGKKVYVFSSVPKEGSDEDIAFDKMLSTFRFIEN